jgi:hypothetical protein
MVDIFGDMIDIMTSLMRNRRASTRLVELAAEVIAADARLNSMIAERKIRKELGAGIFEVLDFGEKILDECKDLKIKFDERMDVEKVYDILSSIKDQICNFKFP